ncbi:MAG: MBL fold metallo-hydrolase [Gammaproteobacteria bacterium]
MQWLTVGVLMAATALGTHPPVRQNAEAPLYRFENGEWFDGQRFVDRSVNVRNGRIEAGVAGEKAIVVDLDGGYIVGGYGDAHTHRLGFAAIPQRAALLDATRSLGMYYVMEQDTLSSLDEATRAAIRDPATADVLVTHTIVGSSQAGPVLFKRRLWEQGEITGVTEPDGELFYRIDSPADLERVIADLPRRNDMDFLKVILEFSEEHDRRAGDPAYDHQVGLDPDLLPELVAGAHRAGLRVSVHIETAADFRVAMRSGADFIAHLPASWRIAPGSGMQATGFPDRDPSHWMLKKEDAREAATRGVAIISTTLRDGTHPDYAAITAIMRHNLNLLLDARANVIIGTDFSGSSVDETVHIHELTGADPVRLLRILTQQTPRAIFPNRRIGDFAPGSEANFLVLAANPLEDLANLRRIQRLVKNGAVIETPARPTGYSAEKIADGVYVLRVEGDHGVDNLGLIDVGGEFVLIDTGPATLAATVQAEMRRLGDHPLRRVLVTHYHHVGANAAFARAEIVAHRSVPARMAERVLMYGVMPIGPFPEAARPDRVIDAMDRFELRQFRFTLRHLANAHTDGDVAVIVEREGSPTVVFPGDVFVRDVGVIDVPNGGRLSGLHAALDWFVENFRDDTIFVPGHGLPGTMTDVRAFREFRLSEAARVRNALRAGRTADEIVAEGVPARWSAWTAAGLPADFFLRNLVTAKEAEDQCRNGTSKDPPAQ